MQSSFTLLGNADASGKNGGGSRGGGLLFLAGLAVGAISGGILAAPFALSLAPSAAVKLDTQECVEVDQKSVRDFDFN